MTTYNNPPQSQMPSGPGGARSQGNGMAVASLICSLLGFCIPFVGGLLGIIFGMLGIKRARVTGNGNGLAVAGLVIGIVSLLGWVVFAAVGGAGYFGLKKMSEAPRATARQYLTYLSQGDVDSALGQTSGLSKEDLTSQVAVIQPLGSFKDMTSPSITVVNNLCTLVGVAQFSGGQKVYTIELTKSGTEWKVTRVVFQ